MQLWKHYSQDGGGGGGGGGSAAASAEIMTPGANESFLDSSFEGDLFSMYVRPCTHDISLSNTPET